MMDHNSSLILMPTSWINPYIDIDLFRWLIWLFTPLLITMLLPALIVILIYISALIAYIYKHRHNLKLDEMFTEFEHHQYWNGALHLLAVIWQGHGYIWHGHEIYGMENIPDKGPALLIYYHGALPLDYYYLTARVLTEKRRIFYSVGDHFLFKIPGICFLAKVLKVFPGTVSSCVKELKDGHLVGIAPGGVREAQFGTHNYELVWAGRVGFAKVIKQTPGIPVIPMFTENIREVFRTLPFGRNFLRKIYDKYKLPLAWIYGGFPVKLRTYIGPPIDIDYDSLTVEEIAEKIAHELEALIRKHQTIPGSIFKALMQRFK